jgi:hypothetical protein
VGRSSNSFWQQRLTIVRLLKSFSDVWQGGQSFPDFAEMGPQGPEGFPFNAEYIRRFFQDHVERETIRHRPLEDAEAQSHGLVIGALEQLEKDFPQLAGAVYDMFFRCSAGHADYEKLKQDVQTAKDEVLALRQKTAEMERRYAADGESRFGHFVDYGDALDTLKRKMVLIRRFAWCEWGLNFLTVVLIYKELFAPNVKRKAIRDAEEAVEANKRIYLRYCDLTEVENKKAKDAYSTLEHEEGLSRGRLEEIIRLQREMAGEPKRTPGRPRKKVK